MKQFLLFILIISILISCNGKKSEKIKPNPEAELKVVETKKEQDTTYNYWELILDTIADKKEFKILDKNYILELKTFSLNDSSIVRNLGQGDSQVYLDHSHTMVTDLKLLTDSIVHKKRIDRTDFEKSLIPEFYAECNLFSTEIDSIIENNIYLTSDLAVPDTDNQWRVWYSIELTNDQLGNLKIKEADHVGL